MAVENGIIVEGGGEEEETGSESQRNRPRKVEEERREERVDRARDGGLGRGQGTGLGGHRILREDYTGA
eukprot:747629-Hanusia_phi.AAC.1